MNYILSRAVLPEVNNIIERSRKPKSVDWNLLENRFKNISLFFVLLTTFITPICILSNWTDITIKVKYFLILKTKLTSRLNSINFIIIKI